MNFLQMVIPNIVNVDELAQWMDAAELSIDQLMGREYVKEAEVVDEWR